MGWSRPPRKLPLYDCAGIHVTPHWSSSGCQMTRLHTHGMLMSSCTKENVAHLQRFANMRGLQRGRRGSSASATRQRLHTGSQPTLYVAKSPLAGMGAILRLVPASQIPAGLAHWMLLVHDPSSNIYIILDFLPENPLSMRTATQLLAGRSVQGSLSRLYRLLKHRDGAHPESSVSCRDHGACSRKDPLASIQQQPPFPQAQARDCAR